ncbi:hypothetical protein DPMN_177069 [Dreissena polymorpha]|uniref:Uncharacterized protein n=1 Tax=Dreissena polymorpha TaxID=45954 RepID=A0A9D4EAB9_DREPO|nr:hypothetical protein DPMN_177069 [Dreissena polymorpha]
MKLFLIGLLGVFSAVFLAAAPAYAFYPSTYSYGISPYSYGYGVSGGDGGFGGIFNILIFLFVFIIIINVLFGTGFNNNNNNKGGSNYGNNNYGNNYGNNHHGSSYGGSGRGRKKALENSVDPDETPHDAASHQKSTCSPEFLTLNSALSFALGTDTVMQPKFRGSWRIAMPLFCSATLPLSKPDRATLPFPKAAALPFHEHPLFSALIHNILIAR